VFDADGVTLSTIFDGVNEPKSNPFTAANTGAFRFFADNGVYFIRVSGASAAPPFMIGPFTISDPSDDYNPLLFGGTCNGTGDDTGALTAIKKAIGSNNATLTIPKMGPCVTRTLALPANITLDFRSSGAIKVETGQTLTIAGPIMAPPINIFQNALARQGSVSVAGNMSLPQVYPEWWGAVSSATPAVQMAALQKAVDTGKRVFLAGVYTADNSSTPLMLNNSATQTAVMVGSGMDVSMITFISTQNAGIQIDYVRPGGPSVELRDFSIRGPAGARSRFIAGNYGIYLPGFHDGVGHAISNIVIENVKVEQFGDNGIRLQGPTGPVRIINSVVNDVGDYGIKITADSKTPPDCPQDVTIDGGSIQGTARGGISIDGGGSTVASLTVRDVDIELGSAQTKPTLYLKGTFGGVYSGLTLSSSVSSLSVGDANIYLDANANGNTFTGTLNYATGGLHNIHVFGNSTDNSFVGGFSVNKNAPPAGLGFKAKVTSGKRNAFKGLFSAASTYAAEHDDLLEAANGGNDSIIEGVNKRRP
jgi:hypothetical protein